MSAEPACAPIGPLRRRDGEPAFAEPWQAQVMALAARLVEEGRFTAAAWSETLGEEIRKSAAAGATDDAASYFAAALAALERLSLSGGLIQKAELAATKEAWIEAYEHTPHGQPVSLTPSKAP